MLSLYEQKCHLIQVLCQSDIEIEESRLYAMEFLMELAIPNIPVVVPFMWHAKLPFSVNWNKNIIYV